MHAVIFPCNEGRFAVLNRQMEGSPDAEPDKLDTELMLRVRQGDAVAMRAIVSRHGDSVYAMARRMLPDSAEAEDLAQRTFIRVWKAAPSYEPTAKFTTWLFTILKNLVFNEVRRLSRKPASSLEEHEQFGCGLAAQGQPSPAEALRQKELEEVVEAALGSLPPKARMAMELRRVQQMNYEEIGAVLGMSLPAVKSLIFRARQALKEKLEDYL